MLPLFFPSSLLLLFLVPCLGFASLAFPFSPFAASLSLPKRPLIPGKQHQLRRGPTAINYDSDKLDEHATSGTYSRRRMMFSIVAGVVTSGHPFQRAFAVANANAAKAVDPSQAAPITTLGTKERPIVIIGGGGRTGMAVAQAIADPGFGNMHAITTSRTGRDPFQIIKLSQATKDKLRNRNDPFDVRESQESIKASLQSMNPSVVVYAASASKQGGDCFEVDDLGVEKVAQACKDLGAIFILISALAVDRPDSKSYLITNTLGGNYQGIMDAKYNGEVKTRRIFSKGETSDYVIVRPGVLLNGKTTKGPVGLELNQGDTIGGGLSRDELAGIVVGAIQNRDLALNNYKAKRGGITVEAYRKNTAQPLEKKYSIPSGNELTIDSSKVEASSSSPSSSNLYYRELFASARFD